MPAWTALGTKSRISVALVMVAGREAAGLATSGLEPPQPPPRITDTTRRTAPPILMATILIDVAPAGYPGTVTPERPCDFLLRGGRVVAGPAFTPSATAIAVAGERVLAVGSDGEVAALRGPGTTVVDLAGRTVIPGLVDGHVHLMRAGQTWEDEVHWDGVETLAEALGMIERSASTLRPGEWVRVVGGWHPSQFREGRGPTRAELDRAAPDNPVYVQLLYREALLNGAGMAACGLEPGVPDPPLGSFERDEHGRPTGRMTGFGAFDHCQRAFGSPTRERQVSSTAP